MSRFLAALGSGLVTAAIGGFLFWWVNGIQRINGGGLVRRQDWPVNQLWFWIAAAFTVGLVGGWVQAARRADHARKAREVAEEQGRDFAEEFKLPSDASTMPVFAGRSDGRLAMSGTADGVPVTLFDITTIAKGSESNTTTERTVALLPALGLPAFDLRPRTFGRRLIGLAGFEGVTFDPDAAGPAEAETVRRFTKLFHLSATEPAARIGGLIVGGMPDSDGSIRRLFTPAIMEAVSQYPGYAVQSHSGQLAVWRGTGILRARRRPELWDAAAELRTALIRPDGDTGPVVPALAGMTADRQARKFRNTLIGMTVGVFVGFILAAMVMSVLFFRNAPGQGPGFGFFGFPLVFFGCLVVGAFTGSFVGSRLPVRDLPPTPPPDPARLKAQQRAGGCGMMAGIFLGFFGGFLVFAGSKMLFDWKLDFGVEGAIFFGSIFGGALVGAILGGVVMSRVARWRGRSDVPRPGSSPSPPASGGEGGGEGG